MALGGAALACVFHATFGSMQSSLPISPGNPLRNVTGLARQISLPGEHAPLRYPSFPALERTAVMGFNAPATLNVPATTNTAITVFRQATYPVWADQTMQCAYVADYRTVSASASNVADTVSYPMRSQLYGWASSDRAANTGTLVGVSGTPSSTQGQPTYPILGADRGLPGPEFVFVPSGATLAFVVTAEASFAGAYSIDVNTEWWSSPGESAQPAATTLYTTSGQRGTFGSWGTVLQGQWVRPTSIAIAFATGQTLVISQLTVTLAVFTGTAIYAGSAANSGTLSVSPATAVCHMPLVAPIEFLNSALPWYASRVTAAALLGTNVTQVLNKGGTVLGGRVSPAVQNAWTVSYSYINGLHPAEKAYLPLETGVYTYCPPSTDLVFFGDYTSNTAFAKVAPLFLLSNDALYNKIFLNAPVACAMACTCTWHIEFRTTSSLFQVGLSGMTLEALHQAQLVLAESGFFFENVEHKQLLSRVVSLAKKYVPDAVSVINPSAGKMLQSIVSRMSNKGKKTVTPKPGPSKPKTTSAKASGITPSKQKGKGKKPKKK